MPAVIPLAIVAGSAISGAIASHSANNAAKAQSASNDKALEFEKQRDAEDRAQFDATQRANYEQYLMKYNAAKALGGEYGLNLPDAKPYGGAKFGAMADLATQGSQGGNAHDPAAFIAQYQANHSPTEGPTGILNAMKQAGFNVAPYMYGQTPSGNEISLNGSKYKVISGENGPTPGWYQAGMDDSAPGARRTASPIASNYLSAMTPQVQPQAPDFKLRSINAFL